MNRALPRKATPAEELLGSFRSFAEGAAGGEDLYVDRFATCANVTTITSVSLAGIVEIGDVMGRHPRCRARAPMTEVRAAVDALLASGFPHIRKKACAPPPPTVPVLRMAVRQGERRIVAELPATKVNEAPDFAQAAFAFAKLGDSARRGKASTHRALVALARGHETELTIEVRFVTGNDRSFSIALTPQGMIVETEQRGPRRRRSALGPALHEERVAIASALLDGAYPEGHGAARIIEGARYVLSVGHADAAVDVVIAPENVHDEDAASVVVRTLYAAATRLDAPPANDV